MKKSTYGIILSLAALLLAGSMGACTRERVPDEPEQPVTEVPLSLSFASRGPGGDAESVIRSVRVFIFRSDASGEDFGEPIVEYKPVSAGALSVEIGDILVPVGYLNVYIVANEQESLAGITSAAVLRDKIVHYSRASVSATEPFFMYSAFKRVRIDQEGVVTSPYAGVVQTGSGTARKTAFPIERTMAKLTVNLACQFADVDGKAIVLDSASVERMPLTSHFEAKEYEGDNADEDYFSSAVIDISDCIHPIGTSGFETDGYDNAAANYPSDELGGFTFYLPEYLVNSANRERYTWLKLTGHLKTSPETTLTYHIPLGNGLGIRYDPKALAEGTATLSSADYTITRNNHYRLKLDIKSFGEIDGVEVNVDIAGWSPVSVDADLNAPYLNISTTSITVAGPVTHRIYFWTNQPRDSVRLEPKGKLPGNGDFVVNDVFDRLADATAANFHLDPGGETGYFDVMLSGNTNSQPLHKIYLKAGQLRREIEINTSNHLPPVPWSTRKWVGTFHRADEQGERIIYAGHTGTWRAEVVDGTEFIRLGNRNGIIDEHLYSETPGDPEAYPVENGTLSLEGSGDIVFRVGMESVHNPQRDKPARYGKIRLTRYNTNGSELGRDDIYVRQGDAADFVYKNRGEFSADEKSPFMQWSPYNLTSAALTDATPFVAGVTSATSSFTKYPTQVGALWQYSAVTTSGHYGRAYHPTTPSGSIAGWNSADPPETATENCPPDFRRPTTAPTFGSPAPGTNPSEIAYSLFDAPVSNTTASTSWGAYADGFFDRHASPSHYVVSPNTKDVAYNGMLFWNAADNASLFFPASDYRHHENGSLSGFGGDHAAYWSSTFSAPDALGLEFFSPNAGVVNSGQNLFSTSGFPVRCVQCATVKSVGLSSDLTEDVLTIVTEPKTFTLTAGEILPVTALSPITLHWQHSIGRDAGGNDVWNDILDEEGDLITTETLFVSTHKKDDPDRPDSRVQMTLVGGRNKFRLAASNPCGDTYSTTEITVTAQLPALTYAVIGTDIWSWASNRGNYLNAAITNVNGVLNKNNENAVIKSGGLTKMWETTTAATAESRLKNGYSYKGDPAAQPDIVLYFAYLAPPNGSLGIALANYAKAGGVIIYGSADGSEGNVKTMLQEIFPGTGIDVKGDADADDSAYLVKDWVNNNDLSDDPIVNGPFGNISGGYIADDNTGTTYVPVLPPGSVQICSIYAPGPYSGFSKEGSFVWYNEEMNFFYIGDSTGAIYYDTGNRTYPAWYNSTTGQPYAKKHGRYGINYGDVTVYNAVLEMNALAWAMTRAARAGINIHE